MDAGEKADVDETGHGTAVASKALGTRYGVAKKVSLSLSQIQGTRPTIGILNWSLHAKQVSPFAIVSSEVFQLTRFEHRPD